MMDENNNGELPESSYNCFDPQKLLEAAPFMTIQSQRGQIHNVSRRSDMIRAPPPTPMNSVEEAHNLSLADMDSMPSSSSSPAGPFYSSASRTETDLRRVIADRIARLNEDEETRVTYLLPEADHCTPNQSAMFIRRLRDVFYPEGSLSQSENAEDIPKPHMPPQLAVPLFSTHARGNIHSFRDQATLPLSVESALIVDAAEPYGSDSSENDFTDEELEPGQLPKGRFITRESSEFNYYEMRRQALEARDEVRAKIEMKKRQLLQINAVLTQIEKENAAPNGADIGYTGMIRETSSRVTVFGRDIGQSWTQACGQQFNFGFNLNSFSEELNKCCARRALESLTFESRRRLRKCVRAKRVAKKAKDYVPPKYMLIHKRTLWWQKRKSAEVKNKRKKEEEGRTRCRRFVHVKVAVDSELHETTTDAVPRKDVLLQRTRRKSKSKPEFQLWDRIDFGSLEAEADPGLSSTSSTFDLGCKDIPVPYFFKIDPPPSEQIKKICGDSGEAHAERMETRVREATLQAELEEREQLEKVGTVVSEHIYPWRI
ncbi:hypothetical protein QR680_006643 [Steinernema hermaphroditum]|uniref:Uncharacterized protein n=1 Tax=Steinernema hermaphroditum TaxID=289476 RepID=A0AA39HYF5_9BILA|nr:hypothetical protein QR680_006643 [Steinernema hermaphroditum]